MKAYVSRACKALLLLGVILGGVSQGGSTVHASTTSTPIEHLIVLMQENHTFDNYFGTYPGADGFPADTCVPVNPFDLSSTACVEPFHIGDQPIENLDHSRRTFRLQYNEGGMDGFVHALNIRNQDGSLALGYYDDRELPFYWNLADEYVLFDRFFSSAAAGSFRNHVYWVTGSPGRGRDRATPEGLGDLPTIFDRLEEKGLTWKFYIQNYDPTISYRSLVEGAPRPPQVEWVPLLSIDRYLDDPALFSLITGLDQFYEDLESGNLPSVSYIKTIGSSEHPPGSLQAGQRVARTMLHALMLSDFWPRSAFLITYDDWGGWYDHVPPPQVDEHGFGFRVPALLVSPYARRGYVDSTVLDYTSILKFIEVNWGLEPLTDRDAQANNFDSAFDFSQDPRPARIIPSQRYLGGDESDPDPTVIDLAYAGSLIIAGLIFVYASSDLSLLRRKGILGQDSEEEQT
jgi:phospholipase C